MTAIASTLFGLSRLVDRRTYALTGFGLMAVKYGLDAALIYVFAGKVFTPLDFFNPLLSSRDKMVADQRWVLIALAVVALPFLWIGISMSFRRCLDAGLSPWLSLLFLVPGVNYLFMLAMCVAPSRPSEPQKLQAHSDSALASALLGTAASVALALVMALISIFALKGYGASLFFGTPFVIGAISAHIHNRKTPRSVASTLGVGFAAILVSSLAVLLFAVEGVMCIAMAAPLAIGASLVGSLIGRAITVSTARSAAVMVLMMLALPLVAWTEGGPDTTLREVKSSVEINAPPETVFTHVVTFSELPPATSFWFKNGIAHPRRARIEGSGVGAIRYCEFSTGPFVEPITVWDAPNRLAFDVTAHPPPMIEWSPYGAIDAPHLDGYFRSKRGEFRLTRLSNGRTLLEGSTWYELDVHPRAYWTLWADALVHSIHGEVLVHIKALAEAR